MQTNSKITIKDILQSPHFNGAKVVAGSSGLDRPVTWVHILEGRKDVGRFVDGQDLILSNGVGFENKQESISFLKELIERNVSGLCIELVEHVVELPEEIIKIANDHKFPLIVFKKIVRFIDITRDFHTMIITKNTEALSFVEKFSQQLNSILLSAHDLEDILRNLHHFLNLNVAYIPNQEQAIFVPNLSPIDQQKTLDLFNSESLSNNFASSPVTVLDQVWGKLYIFTSHHELRETEILILEKCTHAISQDFLRELYIKEKRTHEENKWIDDWINNKLTENEIVHHINNLTPPLAPSGYVVCLINFAGAYSHKKPLRELMVHLTYLARSFFEQQGFYLLNSFEGNQIKYVLLDKNPRETWKERINIVIEQVKKIISSKAIVAHKVKIVFGIGKRTDQSNELPKSFQNALEAVTIQKRLNIEQPLYELLHIYRIISLVEKHSNLKEFALEYLEPIIEYDAKNHTDLLRTLKVYYECNGSKQETAKRLFIVRQTMYFRIQKLEELLGEDFMSPEKRKAVEFALCAYEFNSEFRIDN